MDTAKRHTRTRGPHASAPSLEALQPLAQDSSGPAGLCHPITCHYLPPSQVTVFMWVWGGSFAESELGG